MKTTIKIPSPLSIALALTFFVWLMALAFTKPQTQGYFAYIFVLLNDWYSGVWSLLSFTMQMVLILVLGHMIAISNPVSKFIFWFIAGFKNMRWATIAVLLATLLVSFINWGLGLIFGAVVARKLGEYAARQNKPINYPLICAAAYSGLMIWHGGISGSAPLTVATTGHFLENEIGLVSTANTVFSVQNLLINCCLVLALVLLVYYLLKRKPNEINAHWQLQNSNEKVIVKNEKPNFLVILFGIMMLAISVFRIYKNYAESGDFFSALNLDFINFLLFGCALLFLGNIRNIENAVGEASLSASGILIQFPLYAGIMAVMTKSGMIGLLANGFIEISNAETYPIFTLISAALVNLAVPSGGGQWAVQGPIIIEAAQQLQVSIPKSIMALAYGDELTNMIQPFWALPLLGITKIKASELLPYTFKFMLVGLLVYALGLLLW